MHNTKPASSVRIAVEGDLPSLLSEPALMYSQEHGDAWNIHDDVYVPFVAEI